MIRFHATYLPHFFYMLLPPDLEVVVESSFQRSCSGLVLVLVLVLVLGGETARYLPHKPIDRSRVHPDRAGTLEDSKQEALSTKQDILQPP